VDHCDTEELRRRFASEASVDVSQLHVDAVWGENDLRTALLLSAGLPADNTDQFLDYVVASHVIEHVPDFVGWLDEVHATLRPASRDGSGSGVLRLAVPDKRYCFDRLRSTSVFCDLVEAYALRRRRPSARCILDWSVHLVQVDVVKAWNGEIDDSALVRLHSLEQSMALARDAELNGVYHDVHCWVFTPESFVANCLEQARHGLLKLGCEWLVDTPRNTFEFYASLRPVMSQQAAIDSWQRAQDGLLTASSG
jgi:SAM-dependent methyltransferase